MPQARAGRVRRSSVLNLIGTKGARLVGTSFWRKVREERIWAEFMGEKGVAKISTWACNSSTSNKSRYLYTDC
jgi:hypothetical protein